MWRVPRRRLGRVGLRALGSGPSGPGSAFFSPKVIAVQATLVVGGTIGLLWYNWRLREYEAWEQNTSAHVTSVGTPDLGGPFTLVDCRSGAPTTSGDFLGRWVLMYFGFVNCPEICPAELSKITRAVTALEATLGPNAVVPVFVTIDPHRDSLAHVTDCLSEYHGSFVGLTGTPAQVDACARKWRVYYTTPEMYEAKDKDDYLLDHSIITYLVGPDGEFRGFFSKEFTSANIVAHTLKHVEKHKQSLNPF